MSTEELRNRVRRDGTLVERLEKSRGMIGNMCSKGRPPAMTIPVQWYDEDIYISTTIKDAIENIEKIKLNIDFTKEIPIPENVAVCPACDTQLNIFDVEYTLEEDGFWSVLSFQSSCGTMPMLGSPAFDRWLEEHKFTYDQPYIYWLPVESKIEEWIKEHYQFYKRD